MNLMVFNERLTNEYSAMMEVKQLRKNRVSYAANADITIIIGNRPWNCSNVKKVLCPPTTAKRDDYGTIQTSLPHVVDGHLPGNGHQKELSGTGA